MLNLDERTELNEIADALEEVPLNVAQRAIVGLCARHLRELAKAPEPRPTKPIVAYTLKC